MKKLSTELLFRLKLYPDKEQDIMTALSLAQQLCSAIDQARRTVKHGR